MRLSQLYCNMDSPTQVRNCMDFIDLVAEFPHLKFYQPSAMAPYHWQVRLDNDCGMSNYFNIWPHKMKANLNNGESVQGKSAVRALINRAIRENDRMRRPT